MTTPGEMAEKPHSRMCTCFVCQPTRAPSVVVNAYQGEPGKEPAPTLSPKARRLKQLEGEIATGILELLIVGQQPPTVETLREVTAQAKVVVRANAMFALTKLLPEGLFV